jgi:hypothetical protein
MYIIHIYIQTHTHTYTYIPYTKHNSLENPALFAPLPAWLTCMAEVIFISSALYGGKLSELLERKSRDLFIQDAMPMETDNRQTVSLVDESSSNGTKALTAAAKDAMCEVFEVFPEAARHVASWTSSPQTPAVKARDFVKQIEDVVQRSEDKVWGLLERLDFDQDLVRWSTERDTDLVALVNMTCEARGVQPADMHSVQMDDSARRRLPRLACVPDRSLHRRFLILKLLNFHVDNLLPLVDLSRKSERCSLGSTICELQHLVFYRCEAFECVASVCVCVCVCAKAYVSCSASLFEQMRRLNA